MAFLSMIIYGFVASFTPGPNNIMALYFSKELNFKRASRFSIGVGIGFLSLLIISYLFNELLSNAFPLIELFMKVFAFIYLIYLAYKIVKSSYNDSKQEFDEKLSGLGYGIILQFINPKAIIYALTVVSTFIISVEMSRVSEISSLLVLAVIGFLGTFSWAVLGTIFKKILIKHEKLFNIIMAILLVYVAFSILFH
ncbi:LysE family transporter [Mammaliicoccus stepanovicii]|uniref:Amino acid transporter LysE n=2 Tax=Mammaliicoccus stepanovicii TaxID=643214 RepID=A0A239ZJ77_9STAP|nr:LysE family transporter [Mammaliicoccus stepanovicii]PNZ77976.1 lysine transporter LysE [Mammaliicoccus stepanovicii]GGI41743.1 amino acid transporter LysE [Mammaliicoccus stepanovicii]SNV70778.1 amino acid transporter LysE [Mammaliicoccus stepanovicii]